MIQPPKFVPFQSSPENQEKKWILTMGNFDGFHLGHQDLVAKVLKSATSDQEGLGMIN